MWLAPPSPVIPEALALTSFSRALAAVRSPPIPYQAAGVWAGLWHSMSTRLPLLPLLLAVYAL